MKTERLVNTTISWQWHYHNLTKYLIEGSFRLTGSLKMDTPGDIDILPGSRSIELTRLMCNTINLVADETVKVIR
jgi:hypothetical protein